MSNELKAEVIQAVSELAKFEPELTPIAKKLQGYDIEDPIKVTLFFGLLFLKHPALAQNPQAKQIVDKLSTNNKVNTSTFRSRT